MNKRLFILLQILVWTLMLASDVYDLYNLNREPFITSIRLSGLPKFWFALIYNLGYQITLMIGFYGAYFFIAPYLFIRKKYLQAFAYALLVLSVIVFSRWFFEYKISLPWLHFDNYFGSPFQLWHFAENAIFYNYKYCLLGLVVYFIRASAEMEKEKKEIENMKIQAELSFLRSQINPHFLFNTINDIYALAYKSDPQTPDALLKLSSILRYMLDEGREGKVTLAKEISYLQDYIGLQRIGMKDHLFLNFKIEGSPQNIQVPPLLLIPFIENIFKHGEVNDPANPASMCINVEGRQLTMNCSNMIKTQHKDQTGGIGLTNITRRLELLYPGKHAFNIGQTGNMFNCHLRLDL